MIAGHSLESLTYYSDLALTKQVHLNKDKSKGRDKDFLIPLKIQILFNMQGTF